jgi:MoxR-like ATPase
MMSNIRELPKQYTLRVRYGSELYNAMRLFEQQGGTATADEINEATNQKRVWAYIMAAKWFDNIGIDFEWGKANTGPYTFQYTDITPQQVQVISEHVTMAGGEGGRSAGEGDIYVWPDAPVIPELMENFDKPDWFDAFRTMVRLGKHYSFEGPPSVGKDTAIEQLAAMERKPLVKIGGSGGFRKRDLIGGFSDVGRYDVGEYVAAAINGWWVQLTEVNAADPDALMFLNAQMAPPYVVTFNGRSFPVHPEFRLFVSYNHGLVGTKPLPQSFKDRFMPVVVPFFPTNYQLKRRLVAMGLPGDMADEVVEEQVKNAWGEATYKKFVIQAWPDTVVEFGMKMWNAYERGQMRYQVTTRRLIDAAALMMNVDGMTIDKALEMAVVDAIDSPVEKAAAKQVLTQVIQARKQEAI